MAGGKSGHTHGPDALWPEVEREAAVLGPLTLTRPDAGRFDWRHGAHQRRRAGHGSEFWQYRPLEPGEAVDRVDWRRSGRSDALFTRTQEKEQPSRLLLWADPAPSMDYASERLLPAKRQRALVVTGALALAADEAGEASAALTAGRPARARRVFEQLCSDHKGQLQIAPVSPGDRLVLASDFFEADLLNAVPRLAEGGATGILVQIADPAETSFPFEGRVEFLDGTPDALPQLVDANTATRAAYLAAWQRHMGAVEAAAHDAGWHWLLHRTDQSAGEAIAAVAAWLAGGAQR